MYWKLWRWRQIRQKHKLKALLPCWLYKNDLGKYFMQYAKSGLLIHLTNGLKHTICQNQLYTWRFDKFKKKSQTAIEIVPLNKNNLFIRHHHVLE